MTVVASTRKRLQVNEDENTVAAHETLEDASLKIGRAANVLMKRIEQLSLELEEGRERHDAEMNALQGELKRTIVQRDADLRAAEKAKSELVAELSRREAEWKERHERIEEKLKKVQIHLA